MTPPPLRVFVGLALALVVAPAWSQQPTKVPVVAVLVTHAAADDPVFENLRAGLRDFGYEDGRNVKVEIATAAGQLDRLPEIAAELVRKNVDVIVTPNELSARVASKATTKIPIVMVGYGSYDPVALGLVASFAHPGGNVTGQYALELELEGKRLEMLKEALPSASRVAVLWETPFGRSGLAELKRAAQSLGVRLEAIEVRGSQDLERAFKIAKQKKVGAVLQIWSPTFYVSRDKIAALALNARLPTMAVGAAATGSLLSYGADIASMWKRTAYYIDRLLKGSKASDLPVEQIAKFKLIVNLKTAKALGIKIPESILLRADEVIK